MHMLLKAAAEGQTPRVRYLLRLDKHLVDHSDDKDYMALHHATLSGFEDTVAALFDADADVNTSGDKHGTPLHLAAIKARANVVHLLLENRTVVDHRSKALGLPLHCAAFSGNGSIADTLKKKFNEKPKGAEASAKVSMREMHVAPGIAPTNASLGNPTSLYKCQPFIVALMMQSRDIMEKCMDSISCIEQEFQYLPIRCAGDHAINALCEQWSDGFFPGLTAKKSITHQD